MDGHLKVTPSLISAPKEEDQTPKQRRAHSRVVVRIDVDSAAGDGSRRACVGLLIILWLARVSRCQWFLSVPTRAWLLALQHAMARSRWLCQMMPPHSAAELYSPGPLSLIRLQMQC